MQAIIFANRIGHELAPLCDNRCPALLPLANRPLLEYTLDDLAKTEVEEVFIVISAHADQIEAHFGNGEMWGMRFRYLLCRGEESPELLLQRFSSLLKAPFVALRGDVFRSPVCSHFLQKAKTHDTPAIEAVIAGNSAALYLVNNHHEKIPGLSWPRNNEIPLKQHIECNESLFSSLDNLAAFHQTSLSLIKDGKSCLIPSGRKIAEDITVGRLSKVTPNSSDGGKILVGNKTHIDASARMQGPLIIGHHCFIDKSTSLSNSVILPGTYVGEGLAVENAIISGHHLIRVDFASHIPVADPLLLSNIENEVNALLSPLPERLLGIFLLLISLPLWPIALALTLLKNSHQPMHREPIISNRTNLCGEPRQVVGWQFNTSIPLFRKLPMLWLVSRGDLRLFGCEPLSAATQTNSPCWDSRHDVNAAGLLGPAQLDLPRNSPEEEIRLNEITFIQEKGLFTLGLRLLKAITLLFTARAWQPMSH